MQDLNLNAACGQDFTESARPVWKHVLDARPRPNHYTPPAAPCASMLPPDLVQDLNDITRFKVSNEALRHMSDGRPVKLVDADGRSIADYIHEGDGWLRLR